MSRFGADAGAVDKVFFTHLHGDHVGGWPFLLLHDAFLARRAAALHVFGAEGTRKQLEALVTGTYPDLVQEGKLPFPLEHHELGVAKATGLDARDGVSMDTVPLEHHPSSLGFRFHIGERTLGISGDTRWCSNLEELAEGCDVLILECTSVTKEAFAHVSLEELEEGIQRLRAKQVVLVHLSRSVVEAFEKRPLPGVKLAEDGMALEVS
jgi:ribonuclease BN (tRNA processing enzyme)